jgi:AAA family ATP:ADP antiporter
MIKRLWNLLDVEPEETGPVSLLLAISFLLGVFLATVSVASQSLFLNYFNEGTDLPEAIFLSGIAGIGITILYNSLQGRISFKNLAIINLVLIIGLTAFIEFGQAFVEDKTQLYRFGFILILPFTFITQLIFWGAFGRMFNVRVAKRIIGSVDLGTSIASIIAFFSIPVALASGIELDTLFTIGLVSIIGYLILFIVLANKYLTGEKSAVKSESEIKKLSLFDFLSNKYIVSLSAFVIISTVALRFVDYSFYNISTAQFTDKDSLPYFLSFFEATVVIFSFLFTTFATDRLNQDYGLRVSLIINPILLILFTGAALGIGTFMGYDLDTAKGGSLIYFFIAVAMSKLFVNSLKDALDNPTFKFYYVPIDKDIKIDTQTKIEGTVMAVASTVAGGAIVIINKFEIFNLLTITLFTIPILMLWYWLTNRMYTGYRETLQSSLVKNKAAVEKDVVREYTMDSVLGKEIQSTAEEKVIYGLKLMEKLEPALFESALVELSESKIRKVKQFALDKIKELGLQPTEGQEIKGLASQAAGAAEDSDMLSISPDKLMKISKSVKQADRLLAAKLLRKLTNQKTIFILLELLRDADQKVRNEALLTARKVKKPETWGVLIELLASPLYSHLASAALKEAGEPVLPYIESAFHKSGQNELVMVKLIQIIGHIGGKEGMPLLWKKIDYPDKRIVRQILYSLRLINYRATGKEALAVKELLDVEMNKTLWNLAALDELAEGDHFKYLREALREEIRENYEHLTLLLSLLYEPESIQLVKTNVELGTPDSIQYALELLDLFVEQDLKPKLIPLLDDSSTADKLEKLQTFFPRESYNPIQTLNYILNRDFNYNNRWTKVCAIHSTAYIDGFRVSRGLISQMFNRDKLLQETTAWVIFNKDKEAYQVVADRLPFKDKKFLDSSIENNQLLDGLDDGFFLAIEMVMLIKRLPAFAGITGKVLSDLADKIVPITLNPREKLPIAPGESPILIQASGDVVLKNAAEIVQPLNQGEVFGDLFQEGPTPLITEVEAVNRAVIFKINIADFYFVMASHHDLAQGLIYNVTERKKEVATQTI